jgi:hypothetical protein
MSIKANEVCKIAKNAFGKKMNAIWDFAPCSLVEIALMIEAVSTSKKSVNFYEATQRNIPEDSHLHTRRRENLKSHNAYGKYVYLSQLFFLLSFRPPL